MATSPYFSTSNPYIEYDIHVDEVSSSIANNQTTIRVWVIAWRTNQGYETYGNGYCIVNIDGEEYYDEIDSSQVISYESDTLIFDRTVTINHDADGKKSIYVSASIDHQRFSANSQGFNVTLTAIPRQAVITNASNFNDTQNAKVDYSNPAGNAVTSLKLLFKYGNTTIATRDLNKLGATYMLTLTNTERLLLLYNGANTNSIPVTFTVRTVIAGVTYDSSLNRTVTVINANPTIGSYSYQDSNATTVAITGDNTKIIQGFSTLSLTVNSLAALKQSKLKKISATVNGYTETINLTNATYSSVNFSLGVINSSTNVTAKVTLEDTRGNKTSVDVPISVYSWELPTATISLYRKSNYYNETYLTVNANYSSIGGHNAVTITYQYKETDAGSYSSPVTIQDGVTATINLDNTKTYDFKITVSDLLGSTVYNRALQMGIPILYIDRLLKSVGIGTLPDEPNMLAVDRRIQLKNLNQEPVIDLWSTSFNGGAIRAALFRILNQDSKELIYMNADGTNGNGYIRVNDADGDNLVLLGRATTGGGIVNVKDSGDNSRAQVYASSAGGNIYLANNNAINILSAYAGSYGGNIRLKNNSDNIAGWFWVGSNGDGVLTCNDSSGNETIALTGRNGKISGQELSIKDSNNVVNAWAKTDVNGGQFVACNPSGSDVAWLYANNGGRLWLADDSQNETIVAYGDNGNITCVSLTQTSSRKVKTNIKPLSIDEAVKALQLIAVSFDFKDEKLGKDKRGFIAEDVSEIIPELVTPETDEQAAKLDYIGLIPYLQTIIKNQESRIQDLEKRLTELEKKLSE